MSANEDRLKFPVAVIMERRAIASRWQSHQWLPGGILPDDGSGAPRVLLDRDGMFQELHPGLLLEVFRDEAEGYYLNVHSPEPAVFVAWRFAEDGARAAPHRVTLSYNEAARWMDSQEHVDRVPLPADIHAVLSAWVEVNYRPPEKKQRLRPRSFESKDGRYKGGLS